MLVSKSTVLANIFIVDFMRTLRLFLKLERLKGTRNYTADSNNSDLTVAHNCSRARNSWGFLAKARYHFMYFVLL